MKKLDGVREMLTREQMRKVAGGYGEDISCDPLAVWNSCHSPYDGPYVGKAVCRGACPTTLCESGYYYTCTQFVPANSCDLYVIEE